MYVIIFLIEKNEVFFYLGFFYCLCYVCKILVLYGMLICFLFLGMLFKLFFGNLGLIYGLI